MPTKQFKVSRKQRLTQWAEQGDRCPICGLGAENGDILEADHRVARWAQGPDTLGRNIRVVHRVCNKQKGRYTHLP